MTNILGKVADALGLNADGAKTDAAAAGIGGATEAGGASGTGGLSGGGGVGGTPDDLAIGAAAAASAPGTRGTDPLPADGELRASPGGGVSRTGGAGNGHGETPARSHDLPGGSGAV